MSIIDRFKGCWKKATMKNIDNRTYDLTYTPVLIDDMIDWYNNAQHLKDFYLETGIGEANILAEKIENKLPERLLEIGIGAFKQEYLTRGTPEQKNNQPQKTKERSERYTKDFHNYE